MRAADLLERVQSAGGVVTFDAGKLKVKAPRPLPDGLVKELRDNKSELLKLIGGDDITEHLAERAAIQEFDGGLPRHRAEQAAIERLRVYEYRLTDSEDWLVLIAPGCSLEQAREACIVRFGSRLADIRPHRGGVDGPKLSKARQ